MRPISLIGLSTLIVLFAFPAFAADALQSGKELFSSTELGSNGKSCSSCHPQGKGLLKTATFSDEQLRDTINACIRGPLQGQSLPEDDPRLIELTRYIRSLKQ